MIFHVVYHQHPKKGEFGLVKNLICWNICSSWSLRSSLDVLYHIAVTLPFFTEPQLVLIKFVPNGDLLGYLRKSRGQNDKYFNDPDIKPNTDITSKQLIIFAKDIARGMDFLASNKVCMIIWSGLGKELYKWEIESCMYNICATGCD